MRASDEHTSLADRLSFYAAFFLPAWVSLQCRTFFSSHPYLQIWMWALVIIFLTARAVWHSFERCEEAKSKLDAIEAERIMLTLEFLPLERDVNFGRDIFRVKVTNQHSRHRANLLTVLFKLGPCSFKNFADGVHVQGIYFPVPLLQRGGATGNTLLAGGDVIYNIFSVANHLNVKWKIGLPPFSEALGYELESVGLTDTQGLDYPFTITAQAEGSTVFTRSATLRVPPFSQQDNKFLPMRPSLIPDTSALSHQPTS